MFSLTRRCTLKLLKVRFMKQFIYLIIFVILPAMALSQAPMVRGKVVEEVGGKTEALVGVNVNIVNIENRSLGGVVTELDGSYEVRIPEDEGSITLVFSYIGMQTQRVEYSGQETLNITMEQSGAMLEEVVVRADVVERSPMGISQKEQVTSTQKFQMDEVTATAPITTVEEAIQGRLAGVDIITSGGDPGARSSIRIRGISTLNASSEPLIVIDGVPYATDIGEDFDFATANDEDLGALLNLAPTNIESIEVLKDAAATAIWGTKGANGVLLITTKKGKTGKTNFSFSSKLASKIEPRTIPMLDGNEYRTLMQEAIWNSANYIGMGSETNRYLRLLYDTPEIGYDENWRYFDEFNQENTDWLDEVRQTGLTWDNNLSMSGGGDKANYYISFGYLNDEGTTISTGLERINTSFNVSYQFSDKMRVGADFAFSQSDKSSDWTSNVRSEAFRKMPNKSPFWIDPVTGERTEQYFSYQTSDFEGGFSGRNNYNPVAMAYQSNNNSLQKEGRLTFRMQYDVLKNLLYQGWASINMRTLKNRRFLPQLATGVVWTNRYANQSTDGATDQMDLQTENKLIYQRNYGGIHNIIATGVFRTSQTQRASYSSTTSGNASSGLSDPIVGSTVEGIGSGESEVRNVSGIGLVNYTLLDRYVIQGSVTVEGNSSMGRARRTGYFPTVGVSWNMQNEPIFYGLLDWLSESKIRLSAGQSGRSPGGSSLYLGAFNSLGEYMGMSAIHPVRMQLDNLKWETTTEYNAGLDVGLFYDNVRFTFDYYVKYVEDLLHRDVRIPSTTGYASIKYFNSGNLTNRGWEFRTDVIFLKKKDWQLGGSLNFNRSRNVITKLPANMNQENYSFNNGNYAVRIEEGRPVGSFFGYRYLGVYSDKDATYARDADGEIMNDVLEQPIIMKNGNATVFPGDAKYEDINNDGVINEYDIVYLGNFMPLVTGGAGISVKWRQLTLNSFFHGRFGQKVINGTRISSESMYNNTNQSKAVLRRWRNIGDVTDIPRALYNEGYNYLGSDRFIEDASYLRLKTLSLNYSVPANTLKRFGINYFNVFLTGYDLYTWTKYTGQDPEVSIPGSATSLARDNANTPASVRWAFGINLNF